MQKVSELTGEPVIGTTYLVRCIRYNIYGWTPVVGHVHEDPDLGVEGEHYHRDVRFLPEDESRISPWMIEDYTAASAALAIPLWARDRQKITGDGLRPMKCLRAMPEFPIPRNEKDLAKYRKHLYDHFLGRKVLCGRCPHRGMDLKQLPKDKDGNVICNGHGLKINLSKEVVVKRECPGDNVRD
jgi:hypothetical protein